MCDDILVYGSTQEEHDRNLKLTFERLQQSGITLNRDISEFNKQEITFFGCVFNEDGMKPDSKKIEAIVKQKHRSTSLRLKAS